MFDKLQKHHLGFIIPVEDKQKLESRYGKVFTFDAIQGTHALFVYDEALRTRIEFICQQGRVAKQKPGFAHICYSIANEGELKNIEDYIEENKLGYKLTALEKSASQECGFITFYFIKNIGVVELNVENKE